MSPDLHRRIVLVLGAALLPVLGAPDTAETGDSGEGESDSSCDNPGVFPDQECVPWVREIQGACPELSAIRSDCIAVEDGPAVYADGLCCYDVHWVPVTYGCGCARGRPLRMDRREVRAGVVPHAGWIDSRQSRPELATLNRASRARVEHFWASVASAEHGSIASFHRASLELLAFGAPMQLLNATQSAALDETRHARMAFTLASAFACAPIGPAALPLGAALPLASSLAELAARTAREACIEETHSLAAAMVMLDGARDPAVRRVLTRIVADETRHMQLAWRTVAWAVETGGDEVRAAVQSGFAQGFTPVDEEADPPAFALAAWGCQRDATLQAAAELAHRRIVIPAGARLCG